MMAKKIYQIIQQGNISTIYSQFFKKSCDKLPFPKVGLFSTVPVKKNVLEIPIYKKTDHEYRTTKKNTIKTLETLLKIKTFDALELISKSKDLLKVTSSLMKSNYLLYSKNFINDDTLITYPSLLATTNVSSKLTEIQKLPYDISTIAPLFLLPLSTLEKLVQSEVLSEKCSGRIAILSSLLQITEKEVCELLTKKNFLCTLPIKRIQDNVKILSDFGISVEDIISDLWVLKYNSETIKSRLTDAEKHNIDVLKTWMVRVQPEILQNYIQRRSDNKSILGDSSLTEYLSERLECSVEVANYLILKQPALKNKSLKKLKELIDFLYAAGFKSHHICRVPKILVHSVETTRKRLKQLEDKNIKIDSLHMLTKSKKQFTYYYDALIKSKNKVKSDS